METAEDKAYIVFEYFGAVCKSFNKVPNIVSKIRWFTVDSSETSFWKLLLRTRDTPKAINQCRLKLEDSWYPRGSIQFTVSAYPCNQVEVNHLVKTPKILDETFLLKRAGVTFWPQPRVVAVLLAKETTSHTREEFSAISKVAAKRLADVGLGQYRFTSHLVGLSAYVNLE